MAKSADRVEVGDSPHGQVRGADLAPKLKGPRLHPPAPRQPPVRAIVVAARPHATIEVPESEVLFILEEKGHYSQILQHHVEAGDISAVISTSRSFGAQNPNLWIEALQAVAHDAEATAAQVEEILEMVDRYKLLS